MIFQHVVFPCGEIQLEGILHIPEGNGPFPAVIVCHPHPLYGGDMDNNVVTSICNTLGRSSIASLRFNFRGVGNSGGSYSEGPGEEDDLRAALDFLATLGEIDSRRIGLAGYSFGGMVANSVAVKDNRVKLLALISPALERTGWAQLQAYALPKLIIIGDQDTTIVFRPFQKYFGDPGQYQVSAGADHFWSGFEGQVSEKIAHFSREGFKKQ